MRRLMRAGRADLEASALDDRNGIGIYIIGAVILGLIVWGVIELTKNDDEPGQPVSGAGIAGLKRPGSPGRFFVAQRAQNRY